MSNFRIIAHRGASGYELENSYSAFEKAIELGADMIETDIWQTQDGHLILMHDKCINRTTDGKGKISNLTLKEIEKINLKNGEKIPILEDVLDKFADKIEFNLEIKANNIENRVNELILKYNLAESIMISCFSFNTLKEFNKINPELHLALLTYFPAFISKLKYPFKHCLEHGIEAINPVHIFKSKKYVKQAHEHKIKIYPWTVNKKDEIIKYRDEIRVDGIITNYPDILK
jgi:glycerophosphoryl diester phosphodiesterase